MPLLTETALSRRGLLAAVAALVAAPYPAAASPIVLFRPPRPVLSPPIRDVNGKTRFLRDYIGTPIVLNVWASWCPPCRDEMPSLDSLAETLDQKAVRVLPVCIDASGLRAAAAFFQSADITHLPLLWANPTRAQLALAVFGLPTTILIDGKGREAGRVQGPLVWTSPSVLATVQALR